MRVRWRSRSRDRVVACRVWCASRQWPHCVEREIARLLLNVDPFAAQRSHQHRLDDQQDVFFAGVLRAELRALRWIETAHEQRAEDRRLDAGPIELADAGQNVQTVAVEIEDGIIVEQAAVEVRNLIGAEPAAGRHRVKELLQLRREVRRLAARLLDQFGEDFIRQQFDIFREQAKEQADQKVRGLLRLRTVLAQLIGQLGELGRGLAGNVFGSQRGFEKIGIGEDRAELFQASGREEIVEREGADLFDAVGEIGMDDNAIDVRDDQQRRILQRLTILQELLIGFIEIGVLAFVFPREETFLPHIGESPIRPAIYRRRLQTQNSRPSNRLRRV